MTQLVRQGTTMQLIRPTDIGLDSQGRVKFGLPETERFLAAFGRGGRSRRGTVASPDVGPSVRHAGA